MATWSFQVIPDLPPRIALTKDPERLPRGALKLTYKVEDDYGVASAEAKLEKVPSSRGDPATAWAREALLKGPAPADWIGRRHCRCGCRAPAPRTTPRRAMSSSARIPGPASR